MDIIKPRTAYFPISLTLKYHERYRVSLLSSGWDQVVPRPLKHGEIS